jgi:hypothetical protein
VAGIRARYFLCGDVFLRPRRPRQTPAKRPDEHADMAYAFFWSGSDLPPTGDYAAMLCLSHGSIGQAFGQRHRADEDGAQAVFCFIGFGGVLGHKKKSHLNWIESPIFTICQELF